MTINFKLGPVVSVTDDDMNRSWIGYSPSNSDKTTYEQNRGVWVLGARANRESYATFSHEGTVRVVVEIEGIQDIPALDGGPGKKAIVGCVLSAGDPAYDALFRMSVDGHRNPVTYLPEPSGEPRLCGCGCGGGVPGHRIFIPGHDQRAVHDRITRRWGSTLAFIKWFDAVYPGAA